MADKQKTIDIIFGGVDKTGSAVSSVGNNLKTLENNVGSVTGPLADITGNILKLDTALAAAAAGLTGYAIKLADDFGTAFAEISTLIGEPASSLQDFKNQIQSYAEQSGQSFDEITSATYNAISAGVDYKDSLELIAQAETLSLAGRADLGTTTKALVSTMNAFGAEMSEAGDYADIFFTIVQKGQTTLPELAGSIGRVAPLASQTGVSFAELGAAIAAITAGSGVSANETMTALQATLTAILGPSKQASELAAELGLNFDLTSLRTKNLSGFLQDVAVATGGSAEKMRVLFGSTESLKAVLPLTGSAADKFSDSLESMRNRTGANSTAAKELETDLGRLSQTLKNNVNSALISFGENFTDETAGIIQSMSSMFNSLGAEIKLDSGAFAPIIRQLEGLFKDIEQKFKAMAGNLPEALKGLDFRSLVGAFDDLGRALGGAFKSLFGDIDLSTVEGLESALQTIIDAFSALINITSGIIDGLKPLFELISAGISTFKDLSEEEKKAAGQLLGLATSIDNILPVLGALGTGLSTIGGAMAVLSGAKGLGLLTSNLLDLSKVASVAGKTGFVGAALFGAGAAGAGVGAAINELIESLTGTSLGSKLYDWFNTDEADEFNETIQVSAERIKEIQQAQQDAAQAQKARTELTENDIAALNEHAAALVANANQEKQRADNLEESTDGYKSVEGAIKGLVVGYDEITGKANSWSSALDQNGKALTDNTKKTEEALKQTDEYRLKLLEIASDERIANIEANVSLNIAQLEADTQTAVAIIETLGTSIESTGNVLGELFGAFNDASKFDKLAIASQIEKENKLREQAFQREAELTKAQIELIRKKTDAITRGDSIIKVEAANLAPALELIFSEILKETQMRANQEGLELLIGI